MALPFNRAELERSFDSKITVYPLDFSADTSHDNIPALPARTAPKNLFTFTLTAKYLSDISQSPFELIARDLWGDSSKWRIVADANLPRNPQDWRVGDKVQIPIP